MSKRAIAIVGMACRVPGANTLDAFWDMLVRGQEAISRFDDRRLREAGVDESLLRHRDYVRAKGIIDHADELDAPLFRFTPREAALLDPQHRVMLECAWEALDHAGYGAPDRRLRAGVYVGVGLNTYLLRNLASNRDLVASEGEHQLLFFNDKDFVPTRISYQFDLSGPSVAVQTACSTSLVAVHMACQSLLAHHCDMALAGGAAITTPLAHGYLYREGGILSPDGHCRPFDASANGTVVGNGAGVVVLKRLADAVADGDAVHAVILGSAVNNDGAEKVGYTAPSISGQAAVIAEAQALAGVTPESIGYVEAHGTGTALGDPIEVAALTQAFRRSGAPGRGWCALGSVKSNVGHVDIAAGVVGLIKTVLSLQHQRITPTVHYTRPNPALALDTSPFRIPAEAEAWLAGAPRRAGVSAFGIGGTNAHIVLEEAAARGVSGASRRWQVLPLSAQTPTALAAVEAQIAGVVRDRALPLADVAYTLAVGRRALSARDAMVVDAGEGSGSRDEADAIARRWIAGDEIDWRGYFTGESRQRVVLPPYPFERQRYWIDPPVTSTPGRPASASADSIDDLLYQPSWTRAAELPLPETRGRWLIVADAVGVGAALAERVSAAGAMVTFIAAADVAEFASVIDRVQPDHVVHLGNVTGSKPADRSAARVCGYNSVTLLGDALAQSGARVTLTVVSDGMQAVTGQEVICAEKALVLGPVRVLPQEHPALRCRSVDIEATGVSGERLTQLVAECASDDPEPVVAHRGRHRWVPSFKRLTPAADAPALRRGGVYLITGGMGGVGLTLARHLFETTGAKLVLTGRTPLPPAEEWMAVPAGADDPITLEIEDESPICDPPDPPHLPPVSPLDALVDAQAIVAADRPLETSRTAQPLAERADIAPLLDEISVSHIYEYFAAAGIDLRPGTRLRASDLAARLGVLADYTRFVDFFVQVLVDDGYARRAGEGLEDVIVERATPASSAELRRRAVADHPWLSPLLDLLAHSAAHYHDAMSGRIDALAVLYPKGGSELFERAVASMADHARHRQYGVVIASMLQRLADQHADRPLRILEIGGGNGFLTRQVATALAGRHVEYLFTDISRAFVDRARAWAAAEGLHHLRFGVFDITRDAATQGWHEPFDVVLALDAVHATKDVEASVTNLRRVLRPGGVLYLLETLPPARWNTMAWGLARDWWSFDDRVRTTSPLLSTDQWLDVLRAAGFDAVGAHRSDSPRADCALYFAQRARTSSGAAFLSAVASAKAEAALASPKLAREMPASEGGPIEALAALRARGAEILTLTADVTSVEQMTEAVSLARQRFGTLHGVVHAASEPVAIRAASDAPALSAKTHGLRVLVQVLGDQPLDFLLLCSSTTSLLGGVGTAAYAAANAFLDAFAHERAPRAFPVVSVNWDSWRGVGMAPDIEARYAARMGEALAGGLTVTQALGCFDRIVSLPAAAQVVASSSDFTAAARRAAHDITAVASRIAPAPQHARPAMSTPFEQPRTDVERRVAAVWVETLGVAPIGRDDDYSELGGDSLIAIKVVSRLREELELELRVAALYDWPTVARLAQHIETIRWAAAPVRAPGADEDEGAL